ncbi:alpha/beta fold hydrolase [Nocardia salmonicida]|uniref:alpha/beta fold hydrolase n=1 Tax=Nocardia salmonicida TaxID=53431 RepID=UPI0037A21642
MTNYSKDDTSRWVTVDDLKLRYHEAGDGPPLLMLHGSGPGVSGWANFGANLPVLSRHFRTLIVDQPGFGASERPARFERSYLRISADAVLGLLDELGLDKVHLLGNSMGGTVATRFALDHPDRVDRLVLMAPGGVGINVLGPEPSEGITRLTEFIAQPDHDRMLGWLRSMVARSDTLTEELVSDRYLAATAPGAFEVLRDAYATFYDPSFSEPLPLWAEAKRLTHEVLLAWGQDDRVTPVEGALLPARLIPNADLRIFSRCGHWVQIERKDAFERAVIDFLTNGL